MIKSYRDLDVWNRSIELTLSVYRLTSSFPKEETFTLTSLMRRACISIATHIADGHGRTVPGEYKRLLGVARGANLELQTHLVLVSALGYSTPSHIAEVEDLSTQVAKMLNTLSSSL